MHHCHEQIFEAATLSSFFILGLVGSTHCLGMCGPLTCLLMENKKSKMSVFLYHFARLLSYSVVVLILAIIGSLTVKNMIWNSFSQYVLWAIIVLVILFLAKQLLGQRILITFSRIRSFKAFPAMLGMVTGVLPCGLLIPAYIGASSMPSKSLALLAISLFFAGTLPALLMSQTIIHYIRKKLPAVMHPWLNSGLSILFLLVQVWMISK